MASLTETAYQTRKAINWGILALISYIILRILWSIFIAIWIAVFPPKAPPPNHAFGKLPPLAFPSPIASSGAQLIFELQTIEGTVPKASESATVFFMPKNAPSLLGLTNATDFAKRMDFINDPIQETKYIYRFDDDQAPLRKLRYDIVSKNFLLRYLYENDLGLFADRAVPLENVALSEAKNFLDTYSIYPKDIEDGTTAIQYLKLVSGKLVSTTSLSQSDGIRIDFYRKKIADTPIVTPYLNQGPISFIFSGSKNTKKHIIQLSYTYWPIDEKTTATYALKPSSDAWTELQSGGGYILQYPIQGTSVVVRKVTLAYYDSFDLQTYLQPVFVFEGDYGFKAYVPAVSSEWVENK